ncbi:hypothetical protein [Streptomyces sp. NPDC051677]|uniref:hypothetical protein n=1 Tax=Streptomyces sp. NPDC051677 TaxID=3365669 RepID=UPI0037D1D0ED
MTDTRTRALHPAEPEPGILIHSRADRELAIAHWLLSAHPVPSRAATEWTECGIALLPLGTLMSAVRLPQDLVRAVADQCGRDVDSFLNEACDGGPVICDPWGCRYYALVPAGMPATWHVAAVEWRALGVECLGRGAYLGVPEPRADSLNPHGWHPYWSPYWSVPMPSAGALCRPLDVARIIAAGKRLACDEQ